MSGANPDDPLESPVLEVDELTMEFGSYRVLDELSFSVDREGITALIGPNGAGKTTTYNLITGKLTPTSGRILFDGTDVSSLSVAERVDRGLGRSFQITNIYEGLSVRQNLRIPTIAKSEARYSLFENVTANDELNDQVDQLLELLNLADVSDVVCEELAYGAKRRVEIGVALATDPQLLMLDEPTAGMTPTETVEMVDLIRRLNTETGTTFFVTEHNMNVVFTLASEIIVLHQGDIIAAGPPDEIRTDERVQTAYLGGDQSSDFRTDRRTDAEQPQAQRSLLSVDSIDTYYDETQVLNDVSLTVKPGEIVGLLGRNGAGKTTTLRSIVGQTPPQSGAIKLRDDRIDGKAPHQISKRGVGYVPEEREVFASLTVEENLDIAMAEGSSWTHDRVYEVFPSLGDRSNSMGDQLSGGEQQMLAIARALVSDPDILLLDEPSEGLAPIIVEDLQETLEEIADSGITILLAEQNVEFAFSLIDRNYILDKGRVQWEGTTTELLDNRELIDEYLALSGVEEAS